MGGGEERGEERREEVKKVLIGNFFPLLLKITEEVYCENVRFI